MFYSHSILAKSGPFAHVWLAATWEKKLTRSMIFNTDIATAVESIVNPSARSALRLSANLLVGVVRIYARKARPGVAYLMNDCNEAMVKIRMAFRGGVVDLPEENAVANFDELDLSFEMNAPFGGGVGGGGDGGADEPGARRRALLRRRRLAALHGRVVDRDDARRRDAEGRFGVGGRGSFLGGANEEDLGMTDLEPVAQADLLPPDLPEDDFAPAYAPEDDEPMFDAAQPRDGSLGPVVDDLGAITGGAMDVDDEPPPPAGDDAEEARAEPRRRSGSPRSALGAAPEPGAPESAKGDLLDAGSDAPRFGEDDYDLPPPDFEAGDYAPRPDDDDDLLGPPPDDDGDAGFLQPIDDEDLPAPDDFDRSGAQDRDWHPNTIKVVGLLRDQLDAAESLSFDAFTAGANKRSAVGVFVELLHLKTWDFVQLDQPAAYGDITVCRSSSASRGGGGRVERSSS
ncbi:hypothetical protein JL721_10526 [Aureococcus anophagefferens]|nr:hypothetical protein JL721_10526 [Aureococcus anophagefferens]